MRRLRAFIAIIAFTSGSISPLMAAHQVFDDDAACDGVVFTAGPAVPQFAPPEPVRVAGHCAICHWLRTAAGARAAVATLGDAQFQVAEMVVAPPNQWAGATDPIDRPSRAPPTEL